MAGAIERHSRVLEVHALQRGRESIRVALAPDLTVRDDVDARPLHVQDGKPGRVILGLLQQLRREAPNLEGSGPRRQPAAKERAVDQPVRLWIAADDRGLEERA